jgi:hypothetical protein
LLILKEEDRLARLDRLHGFDRAHLRIRLLLVDVAGVVHSLVAVFYRCSEYVTVLLHLQLNILCLLLDWCALYDDHAALG